MRKAVLVVLIAMLVAQVPTLAWSQGKIATDPNSTPRAVSPAPEPLWKTDKRLDQKIEYDAGHVRLHDLTAELAKMSGVTIYCGKSDDDWRERDIPMTVAARGISLRDLLQHIVFTTHSQLVAKKNDKGVIYYRIITDPKLQQMLDDYEKALEDYPAAMRTWSLETASKLRDIPASSIKQSDLVMFSWQDYLACRLAASSVLAALEPDVKKTVLSGQAIYLSPASTSGVLKEALTNLLTLEDACNVRQVNASVARAAENAASEGRTYNGHEVATASAAEIQNSLVRVGANSDDVSIRIVLRTEDENRLAWREPDDISARSIAWMVPGNSKMLSGLPKQPSYPKPPSWSIPRQERLEPAFIAVSEPVLDKKIAVKLKDDGKPVYCADALIAVSKASGITIVCEDDRTILRERDLRGDFAGELTFRDALTKASPDFWWLDKYDSAVAVVCWCGTSRPYVNLIPERIVSNITSKANGDGADLDDFTCLTNYSADGVQHWLRTLKDNPAWMFCTPSKRLLWQYYDSLSLAEKEQAKGAGLELGKRSDLAKLVQGLKNADYGEHTGYRARTSQGGKESAYERLAKEKVLSTLKMRLQTNWDAVAMNVLLNPTTAERAVKELVPEGVPAGFKMSRGYTLIIEGVDNGETVSVSVSTEYACQFPYFSPERTQALTEICKKSSEAKK